VEGIGCGPPGDRREASNGLVELCLDNHEGVGFPITELVELFD
jgi:hypothetical protein